LTVDGDGGKWKWGADGKVEWSSIRARDAKFGNKKSEKKRKKYHHYNSERIRTQSDPLVMCGRFPDELPLRLPLISH